MGVESLINKIKDSRSLLEFFFNADDRDYDLIYDEDGNEFNTIIESEQYIKENFGEFELIDQRYDTSEFWSVVYFKDFDIYVRIDGEYDSYGQGEHEYDEIKQVFPKEITTTIYE